MAIFSEHIFLFLRGFFPIMEKGCAPRHVEKVLFFYIQSESLYGQHAKCTLVRHFPSNYLVQLTVLPHLLLYMCLSLVTVTDQPRKRSGSSASQKNVKHMKRLMGQEIENMEDDGKIQNSISSQEEMPLSVGTAGPSRVTPNARREDVQGRCKKPKGRRNVWSAEETKRVTDYFQKNIRLGKVPQKHECLSCKNALTPLLDQKDWKNIKYKVYNTIQSGKRR
ncbi:hypothetical protein HOLleu_10516 [Holothuria leucospilota]|uniref:Uncharacterized protein n=1 Tax=Holothuria leucospilota TaxID=206669 RepID=A0A9Q1CDP3_HOLLE|nr:hypothetical protein HOLleu_10516 [Holothuria leucospilota]